MPSNRPDPSDPLPESAMGGASDAGAHGRHPASHPEAPPLADMAAGDAAIERRHHHDDTYRGPERRLGRPREDRT
jgi:hypothetical protein